VSVMFIADSLFPSLESRSSLYYVM
jgi:hypothetical protein